MFYSRSVCPEREPLGRRAVWLSDRAARGRETGQTTHTVISVYSDQCNLVGDQSPNKHVLSSAKNTPPPPMPDLAIIVLGLGSDSESRELNP